MSPLLTWGKHPKICECWPLWLCNSVTFERCSFSGWPSLVKDHLPKPQQKGLVKPLWLVYAATQRYETIITGCLGSWIYDSQGLWGSKVTFWLNVHLNKSHQWPYATDGGKRSRKLHMDTRSPRHRHCQTAIDTVPVGWITL